MTFDVPVLIAIEAKPVASGTGSSVWIVTVAKFELEPRDAVTRNSRYYIAGIDFNIHLHSRLETKIILFILRISASLNNSSKLSD